MAAGFGSIRSAGVGPAQVRLAWIAALLCCMPLSAQEYLVSHCEGFCPRYEADADTGGARVVIHHLYAAAVNGYTGLPDWVAYRLSPKAQGVASLLERKWQPDPLARSADLEQEIARSESELALPDVSANAGQYGGAGAAPVRVDRARLAPMVSFAGTPYWAELNHLSNMVPMPADLRLGPWLQLEQALNRLSQSGTELTVVTGPIYFLMPGRGLSVDPAAYFKVISDGEGMAAFLFSADLQRSDSFCAQQSSLAEIEQSSSLDLFPERTPMVSEALLAGLGC